MATSDQTERTKCDMVLAMPLLYHVEPETFESLWLAASAFGRDKIRTIFKTRTVVDKARDRLSHRFLHEYDSPRLIFCDGDMGFPWGNSAGYNAKFKTAFKPQIAGINFFERMMSYGDGYDIVGGAYFDRENGTELQAGLKGGTTSKADAAEMWRRGSLRGLVEVDWVGSAGMMIKRHVFEAMTANLDKYPEMKSRFRGAPIGFFTRHQTDFGEDTAFCFRAKQLGFKVWLDADLKMAHKGAKFY